MILLPSPDNAENAERHSNQSKAIRDYALTAGRKPQDSCGLPDWTAKKRMIRMIKEDNIFITPVSHREKGRWIYIRICKYCMSPFKTHEKHAKKCFECRKRR